MAPIRARNDRKGGGTSGRDTSGSCDEEKAARRETRTTTIAPTVVPGDATFSGWDIRGVPMRNVKPSRTGFFRIAGERSQSGPDQICNLSTFSGELRLNTEKARYTSP
jgi:hypothetical protein